MSCSCTRTAPSPTGLAPLITLVGALCPKYARVHALAIFSLRDSKDLVCSGLFEWYPFLSQSSQRLRQRCKAAYEPATVVVSSNVGIVYRLLTIACFAYVISMHRRICEMFFGTITTGFTKGVGPSTGSIIPRSRISVVLSWTFSLRLKGILPGVSQWGLYPGIFACISTS